MFQHANLGTPKTVSTPFRSNYLIGEKLPSHPGCRRAPSAWYSWESMNFACSERGSTAQCREGRYSAECPHCNRLYPCGCDKKKKFIVFEISRRCRHSPPFPLFPITQPPSIRSLFFEDEQATTLFPLSLSLFPTHTHRTDTETHLTLRSSLMFARKHAVEQQRSSINKP